MLPKLKCIVKFSMAVY